MARPTRLTAQQQRIIRELVAKHTPLIQAAFLEAVRNAHGAVDFADLVDAVQRNDWDRIERLLRLNQAMLFPLEEAIRTATVAGGAAVVLPKGIAGSFSFNGRHPRAEQIIAEMGARLVTEIGSPGIEPIRAMILQAQQEGVGAQVTARRLAGVINPRTGVREGGIMGLDGPRAQRSARVREILNDPDQIADYFKGGKPRYTSTDRRFDAQVRRAIAEGRALDKATIDRIAKAHDARLLKARGQTIAKNEAFRAQAQGRNEAYRQLMDSGRVETIQKRWQHATAKDPRHDHAALDGKEVGLDEGFVMGDGATLQYPHDPSAGPQHTIGCRCSVIYVPQYRRMGKTGDPTPTSPRDRLKELSKDGNEHMLVMDNGKPIFEHTSGDSKFISIPSEKFRVLSDPSRSLTVMHNHPIDNVSFSPADLFFFKAARGVSEFTAETTSTTFRIKRTAKTAKISESLVSRLSKEYDRKVAPDFVAGKKTIYEIENERPNAIASELHRLKYLKYSVEKVER